MPRWTALPDELDPQVREFTGRLRRLVDHGGLDAAALADRTGYSATSWERYLDGRLLAPKGAIIALAEVTGTSPAHLTELWELAERAWSRSGTGHDPATEALRIARAGSAPGQAAGRSAGEASGGGPVRMGGGAANAPATGGAAGAVAAVPAQPTASDADVRDGVPQRAPSGSGSAPGDSGGAAGRRGASRAGAAAGPAAAAPGPGPTAAPSGGPGRPAHAPAPHAAPAGAPRPTGTGGDDTGTRRLTVFVAGAAGALLLIGAVLWFTDGGGHGEARGTAGSPAPAASTRPALPAGVGCSGAGCTGKDAEAMGCSGDLVTTDRSATVGTAVVEVRYSRTCGAAWGRVTQGAQGDRVRVEAGALEETGTVTAAGATTAYTPMVAVRDAAQVRACVTLASGRTGCTT
ncbi:DUF2690 domain-containing protein [Streptomyces sp. NPDC046831]|uniref:helix-turn-helix domain-containing protein n=1 Tax=Streptomyces sp. NPDC046831 TaxID=3154805 RepID=UPI00340923D3